ncbi:hypothetical protein BX616_003027 [Lobosporangium transversale]|nr:hypothetical protein BX616_003027 [Lobosporangium transversale]
MLPNHRENAATEKYYQYSSKKSGSFPWRHLRPDINEKLATQRRQDKEEENSDDDEAEAQETAATRSRERGKERAEEGLGDQDPSSFSRPAMPRQQKSWWMEQIEANRAKR